MARVLVAAQTTPGAYPALQPGAGTLAIAFQAADAALMNYTPCVEGKTYILVTNVNASPKTVTFTSVADSQARTGDITSYSIAQYAVAQFGPFKAAGWSHGSTSTGGIWIDNNSADVHIAVLTLP